MNTSTTKLTTLLLAKNQKNLMNQILKNLLVTKVYNYSEFQFLIEGSIPITKQAQPPNGRNGTMSSNAYTWGGRVLTLQERILQHKRCCTVFRMKSIKSKGHSLNSMKIPNANTESIPEAPKKRSEKHNQIAKTKIEKNKNQKLKPKSRF